jgi:hypothetical protein
VATTDASAVVARTDVGLYKDDQRHTPHVVLKDRDGKPASGLIEMQQFGQVDPQYVTVGDSGTLILNTREWTYEGSRAALLTDSEAPPLPHRTGHPVQLFVRSWPSGALLPDPLLLGHGHGSSPRRWPSW